MSLEKLWDGQPRPAHCLLRPGAKPDLSHPGAWRVSLEPGLPVLQDRLPQPHPGSPTPTPGSCAA